jgi:hypothetical protein
MCVRLRLGDRSSCGLASSASAVETQTARPTSSIGLAFLIVGSRE